MKDMLDIHLKIQIKLFNNIKNIIFEDLNDEYAYGKLGPFKVLIMKENGYINATKLCNNAGKEFQFWMENKSSKELIKEVRSVGIPTDSKKEPHKLIIKVLNGSTKLRGTYVHPKLIIHIASWCSPSYAVQVSEIVIEYHSKEAIDEKEKLLKKKDDKIDKMSSKIDKLLSNNKELLQKNSKMDERIKRLLHLNNKLYTKTDNIEGKLDEICNYRVVPGESCDDHMLLVIKNNINYDEYDDDEEIYDYHIKRLMKKNCHVKLNEYRERFPDMEILLRIDYSPNAVNLWIRVKKELRSKIEYCGCNVNLKKGYSENRFIRDILKIHNKRFDYNYND